MSQRGLSPGGTRGMQHLAQGHCWARWAAGLTPTWCPVRGPSDGDQAVDGRHYQTVLDRRTQV